MMNIPFISVIVPVYNAELYLEKCIDSILQQSFKHFELILIDDASTDKSLKICQAYKKKDTRIIVLYNKKNLGAAGARNKALDIAKGKYIIFIDSDDFVDKKMFEIMFHEIEDRKAAIVQCGFCDGLKKYHNGKHQKICWTKKKSIKKFLTYKVLNGYIGGKLFRKSAIGNIRFDTAFKVGEDGIFVLSVILHSDKVVVIDDRLYIYNHHENSLSSKNAFSENIFDNFKQVEAVYEMYIPIDNMSQVKGLKDAFAFVLYYRIYRDLIVYNKKREYPEEWKRVVSGLNITTGHAFWYGKLTTKMKGMLWIFADKN